MKRPKKSADAEFILFDVLYEDGARSSNRKVPASEVSGGRDEKAALHAYIETQDRKIAEMSGRPRGPVKSMTRSAVR